MSNVFEFKRVRGRSKKPPDIAREQPNPHDEGSIRFTVNGDESEMHLTGVYERRLQFGVYTLIKGISALVDKLAANGAVGNFSCGPIHENLPAPPRRPPRRLVEDTDFGGLR